MPGFFASAAMAAGYAYARPPVHPRVIDRVRDRLGLTGRLGRALDVGCGAGLSTRPLHRIADHCFGIEPLEEMLRWSSSIAPRASFAAATAEELPVRSGSIDIITAAGSLNYADLDRFFPEAARVLAPGGVVVIYDFLQGRSFRGEPQLDAWYEEFLRRYPPSGARREVSPESLAALDSGFRLSAGDWFEIGLVLTPDFYLNYAMTETNVSHAVASGVPEEEIRSWCSETLRPVFRGEDREVLFRGYIAYMAPLPG